MSAQITLRDSELEALRELIGDPATIDANVTDPAALLSAYHKITRALDRPSRRRAVAKEADHGR